MINSKKIIVLVLALLSMLLMFSGWVKVPIDDLADEYNLDDYDVADFVRELEENIDDMVAYIRRYGVNVSTKDIKKILNIVKDGKLSPSELNSVSSIANSIIPKINKKLEESSGLFSYGFDDLISETTKYNNYARLYRFLYALVIISFLYYIFATIMDKKGTIVYPIMVLILLIVFAVLASIEIEGIKILSMTLWPFISLIFAFASIIIYKSKVDNLEHPIYSFAGTTNTGTTAGFLNTAKGVGNSVLDKTKGIDIGGGWQCPYCGNKNSKSSKFCSTCGKANPNVVNCPQCGLELKNHEKFCPQCGTIIDWPQTEKICPNCGQRNKLNVNFCENCGTNLNNTNQS